MYLNAPRPSILHVPPSQRKRFVNAAACFERRTKRSKEITIMQLSSSICVLALVAGAVHQAYAARQLSPAASRPEGTKQFLPHKDINGVWQPANFTGLDFNTLTLADLPTPDTFLEIAMTSPYPMPNIPLMLLVNNTFKNLNGGKIPASVDDWARLLLVEETSKTITSSMSHLLVKYLPNITLPDGKVLSVGEKASKMLTSAISDITSGYQAGGSVESVSSGAAVDAMSSRMAPAAADFTPGIIPTLDMVTRLPNFIRQATQNVGHAVDGGIEMPQSQEESKDNGKLGVPGILKSTLSLHTDVPTMPTKPAMHTTAPQIPTKTIVELTKALPSIGDRLGLNTTAIKFPDAAAVETVLTNANGQDLFVTDQYGRMDLLATLTQLPQKLPELKKAAQAVEAVAKPPQGWPDLEEVAGALWKIALPKLQAPEV